jgi:glycosyltransferase involved in cell wall biosynthesis
MSKKPPLVGLRPPKTSPVPEAAAPSPLAGNPSAPNPSTPTGTLNLDASWPPPRPGQRRFLFIHQNFPAQFVHVAAALAAQGHEVVALAITPKPVPGVRVVTYKPSPLKTSSELKMAQDFETKLVRGLACAHTMQQLAKIGFVPDVIIAHSGWGEALFCKDVWPDARLVVFSEFYYSTRGSDYAFDPEFSQDTPVARSALRLKNTALMHALSAADAAYAPTQWQRDQVPEEYRSKVRVIHDGINTRVVKPDPASAFKLPASGATFTAKDEILTFVNRNLEPYRGFHIFMRALPAILRTRPHAQCVIVGGDDVSYGRKPAGGGTWRDVMLKEVGANLPLHRVHFTGNLPYADYLRLLQVSSCHVYLTYPFVLSWSCLEAMSAGCVVVGGRTAPVEEVIEHGVNGVLTNFFDVPALSAAVVDVLDRPQAYAHLRTAARATVEKRFDLQARCLPRLLNLIDEAYFHA